MRVFSTKAYIRDLKNTGYSDRFIDINLKWMSKLDGLTTDELEAEGWKIKEEWTVLLC